MADYTPVQASSPSLSLPGVYKEWKPHTLLQQYIHCYWFSARQEQLAARGLASVEMIVPDGCVDLIIRKSRELSDPQCLIIGAMDRAVLVDMEHEQTETFGIRFYPGGLASFLRESAHLFTNKMMRLSEVSPALAIELQHIVESAPAPALTVLGLDRLFIIRFLTGSTGENTFRNALLRICQVRGNISVQELARSEAISERQLSRLFLEQAGVSTKTFSRIIRFQHFLTCLHQDDGAWTYAALEAGYYDQAHCIRDFHAMCGMSPSEYRLRG